MSLVSTLSSSDHKEVKSKEMKPNANDKFGTMHKFRMAVPDPQSHKPILPVQSDYDISRILSADEPLHVVLRYPDGNVGKI
ncbi:hypothetical protein N7523_003262 [Penicillium sp. IBT 18751x]|nr:hypothetical protein N7523_003262 [Penicillium sp. IBT 18751x]